MRCAPLLLVAALAVGCGGSDEKDPAPPEPMTTPSGLTDPFPTGDLSGRLVDGAGTTVRGSVEIVGEDGSTTRTEVDSGGEFRIQLSPGVYRVTGTSPDAGRCGADPVTLEADAEVSVDVVCAR